MAKIRLSAGAEFDVLNQDELERTMTRVLRDWQLEAARGPKHVRFSAMATITSGGTVELGGNTTSLTSGKLGPDPSMVWSVKRWCVSGLVFEGDELSAYINNAAPNTLVKQHVTGYDHFGSDSLVIMGGDALLFTGAGLISTGNVFVSGAAWELPASLAYQLL